jgi:hypothetical protein
VNSRCTARAGNSFSRTVPGTTDWYHTLCVVPFAESDVSSRVSSL